LQVSKSSETQRPGYSAAGVLGCAFSVPVCSFEPVLPLNPAYTTTLETQSYGIRNFWPGESSLDLSLLAALSDWTSTSYWRAMPDRVSPFLTV